MKKNKFLVPLVLVVIFVASFYMLYDGKQSDLKQYNLYLEAARKARSFDIQVDAEANYMAALDMSPSIELYLEIGNYYIESGQAKKAIKWGEKIMEIYPKDYRSYEFQMDQLIDRRDYAACFSLANEFTKRKVSSEKLTQYIADIEYKFYLSGEYDDVTAYNWGKCAVSLGGRWGFVDVVGTRTVPLLYPNVGAFLSNFAPVVDGKGAAYYIDYNGNKRFVVVDVGPVVALGPMENGVYPVYNGDTWSFYNLNYEKLFGEFKEISSISNGLVAVKKSAEEGWSLRNCIGEDLAGRTYYDVVMDENGIVFRNNRLFVGDGTGYQLIDYTGAVYGDAKFQAARVFNDGTYAAVMLNEKWGFVDSNGNFVIEPQYEDARSFSNGLAAVKKDGKWGFINTANEMVIEPQFKNAKDFNYYGCAFVVKNESWELLKLYKYNY